MRPTKRVEMNMTVMTESINEDWCCAAGLVVIQLVRCSGAEHSYIRHPAKFVLVLV